MQDDVLLEAVLDRCVDLILIGGQQPEDVLAEYAEFRDDLEPLLVLATVNARHAVPDAPPDPTQRTRLMQAIRELRQDPPPTLSSSDSTVNPSRSSLRPPRRAPVPLHSTCSHTFSSNFET